MKPSVRVGELGCNRPWFRPRNTEGNRVVQSASLFSQLLHEVPRNEFARLVNTHQGERHANGFTCWAQCTAMLCCQLAHADSLREICNGLRKLD